SIPWSLEAVAAAIDRLVTLVAALDAYSEARSDTPDLASELAAARSRFEAALDDDLNVSAALAAVFDLARELNRRLAERSISSADAARALPMLRALDRVLAIVPDAADELPAQPVAPLAARVAARPARAFAASAR